MYTWQEIEQEWLGGVSGLAASPDEVLSAFNAVAARFGREWVEATRTRNGVASRGAIATLYIVTMARLLRSLDGATNAAGLLEKVRPNDPTAPVITASATAMGALATIAAAVVCTTGWQARQGWQTFGYLGQQFAVLPIRAGQFDDLAAKTKLGPAGTLIRQRCSRA